MTAQKDQIQRLIRDIDQVLSQSSSRLPWGMATQINQQRQLLIRLQQYLRGKLAQQQEEQVQAEYQSLLGHQAQDVMQSVIQEMTALRSSLLHPLHSELATLMQQRTALLQEIRQLEAHRQMLQQSTGTPPASIDTLQNVSDRADQMLTTLDTTLQVVFASLQKDIHTYHDSLSDGIDKLHTLGRQSEAMFSGLVRQLAEQFGRDASTYLPEQAALAAPTAPANQPLPAPVTLSAERQPTNFDADGTEKDLKMPYAGMEFAASGQPIPELSPESIHNLGELFTNFLLETDSSPTPVPAPRQGATPDLPLSPEIRALREAMLPLFHGTEPAQLNSSEETGDAIAADGTVTERSPHFEVQLHEVSAPSLENRSSSLDVESAPVEPLRSTIPPDLNVFTLNGIDNVFLDEENSDDRE